MRIHFLPDTTINYTLNPYKNNTAWVFQKLNSDQPDNHCENLGETMSYRFYIEPELINSQ